jgi:hypothetical protein
MSCKHHRLSQNLLYGKLIANWKFWGFCMIFILQLCVAPTTDVELGYPSDMHGLDYYSSSRICHEVAINNHELISMF